MTTYTAIANTEIDADSPVTTTLMQSMRDNPIATAEGSADAPVVAAGWHPYDMVTVGDGNDGVIYDAATDGAVASVQSPAFEDGYEYMLEIEGLQCSTGPVTLDLALYLNTAAAYQAWVVVSDSHSANTSGGVSRGLLKIPLPAVSAHVHATEWVKALGTAGAGDISTGTVPTYDGATVETIGGIQVRYSSGNIDTGKIKLHRRREYITA